jgi:hypothetical protein
MQKPELFYGFAHIDGHPCVGVLYQECVGADIVGSLDIAFVDGGGQDDDDEGFEAGLAANPFEHLHSHFDGEFQIEEDEGRERELLPIGVLSIT